MYQAAHYNAVFKAMQDRFGEAWYNSVNWPTWGIVWRRQIKTLFFDKGILISEMITALDEAGDKKKWPHGVAFFHRLHDVCLKNRVEARRQSAVRVDGMKRLGDLLPRQ